MTGPEFKSIRQSLGLSVSGLAMALGCGKRTVMRIEADGPTRMAELAMRYFLIARTYREYHAAEDIVTQIYLANKMDDLMEDTP